MIVHQNHQFGKIQRSSNNKNYKNNPSFSSLYTTRFVCLSLVDQTPELGKFSCLQASRWNWPSSLSPSPSLVPYWLLPKTSLNQHRRGLLPGGKNAWLSTSQRTSATEQHQRGLLPGGKNAWLSSSQRPSAEPKKRQGWDTPSMVYNGRAITDTHRVHLIGYIIAVEWTIYWIYKVHTCIKFEVSFINHTGYTRLANWPKRQNDT